jgi:hypothetical protein
VALEKKVQPRASGFSGITEPGFLKDCPADFAFILKRILEDPTRLKKRVGMSNRFVELSD